VDSSAAPVAVTCSAAEPVELGGAFLTGFDQIREFYRVCEDSEVLRRQLVQIAMLDGARVLYLAVHEGRSDSRSPPTSVTAIPHPRPRLAPPCSPNSPWPKSRSSIGTRAS
jgi:hypothetical protein